jgi:hypothetical protein
LQLGDAPNNTPYTNKKIFAVSQIAQFYKNTVTLRFNPALFYNNANISVQNLWVNFGNGYTLLPANTDISYTYTDSTGYHRIAIKAQMSNEDIVETYTAVMVEVTDNTNSYTLADLSNPDFVIDPSQTQSGCRVYIRRSVATPANQILRPFIVAEGLDLHDGAPAIARENYDVNDLIREWERIVFNGNTINFNFDDIGNYDLVFIDWNNGVDDILRNALTLEQVIEEINRMNTGTEQNVIMGISLGGLVARYCLADMTKHNRPSQTRLLITHDSPHQGAYVPLAFQHLVTALQNRRILGVRLGAIKDFIDQGVSLLNTPGAQQQLRMVVTNQDGAVAENTFLQNVYRPMITFAPTDPQPQYQFIATSQGSQCGNGTIPIGSSLVIGEALGNISGLALGLRNGIFSRLKYKVNLAANGLTADGGQHEILFFKWRRQISLFWGIVNTSKTLIELHRNEPTNFANPIPWESVPAGTEDLRFNNQTIIAGSWSVFYWGFLGYDARFVVGQPFSFCPVISALDIADPNNINRNNIFNFQATVNTPANTFIPQRIIAQERFFGTSGSFEFNQPHTDFTSRNGRWIFNEMENIPQPINCDDQCPVDPASLFINGNNIICNSEQYSISNLPAGSIVTWSIPGSAGTVLQLNQNTPGPNQLTITNQRWYTVTTTLTAIISNLGCGAPDQVRTMIIANDNSTSAVSPFPYYQEACYFYNVYHPSQSGTAYSNSSPIFVHMGCMVYVNLGTVPVNVTLASGSGQPMFWSVGAVYYPNTLYFQLPLGSGGVPFVFEITGNGACFNKTLLFFPYGNNERYVFEAAPNPVKNILTVTAKENEDLLLQTKAESTKENLQFIMNIYDVNTNTLQMTQRSSRGSLLHQINTSSLKTGYYVLQIIEDNQTQSIKFFKE